MYSCRRIESMQRNRILGPAKARNGTSRAGSYWAAKRTSASSAGPTRSSSVNQVGNRRAMLAASCLAQSRFSSIRASRRARSLDSPRSERKLMVKHEGFFDAHVDRVAVAAAAAIAMLFLTLRHLEQVPSAFYSFEIRGEVVHRLQQELFVFAELSE